MPGPVDRSCDNRLHRSPQGCLRNRSQRQNTEIHQPLNLQKSMKFTKYLAGALLLASGVQAVAQTTASSPSTAVCSRPTRPGARTPAIRVSDFILPFLNPIIPKVLFAESTFPQKCSPRRAFFIKNVVCKEHFCYFCREISNEINKSDSRRRATALWCNPTIRRAPILVTLLN